MALGADELILILKAKTGQFSSAMDKAGRDVAKMSSDSKSKITTLGKISGVGLGIIAAGAVAAGAASVKMASQFDRSMEMIHTQAGASQAEVDKMSKAVLNLAGPTATAPDVLAQGLFHIESAGMRGQKALDALKIAAEGAKVGGANLVDVTNALNSTLVSGISGAKNMSSAMGALNATVGAGDMTMQNLADAVGNGVTAAATSFGVNLNDMGAALAVFGDNNIRGADAGSQFRMMLQSLSKPAATGQAALKSLGLTETTLAKDLQSGGLNKALTDLHDHLIATGSTGAKAGAILTQAFGKKAGVGINVLMDQFDRFKTKQEEIARGANKFGDAWKHTKAEFSTQMSSLKATLESVAIKIGNRLIPIIQRVAKVMGTWLSFIASHKAVLIAVAVAIGGVLTVAALTFAAALAVQAAATWTAILPLLPFIAIALAVVAALVIVGVAIYEVVAHFKTIKKWVKEAEAAFDHFVKGLSGPIQHLVHTIEKYVKDFIRPFIDAFQLLSDLFHGRWGKLWGDVVKIVKDQLRILIDQFIRLPMAILGALANLGSMLLGLAGRAMVGLWNGFVGALPGILSFFITLPIKILGLLAGAEGWLINTGIDILTGLWNGLISFLGTVMDFFTSLPGKIIGWLGDVGSWLVNVGEAIVDGLVNGLKSAWHKVTDFLSSGVSMIKKIPILGGLLGSPSPYFHTVGEAIAQGLVDGIRQGQPTVNMQMSSMVAGLRSSGAQAIGPPSVSNTTNLNLTAMSTSTATEIANEIAWALRAQHAA